MSALAKPKSGRDQFIVSCQVAKKNLGMDDEAYRSLLLRVAGVRSSTLVSPAKKKDVLEELKRLGAVNVSQAATEMKDRMQGPYAGKLQALWIAGYNLGIINNKTDKACMAFVERMTKISHSRFLHQHDDGSKAIEALKKWLERSADVSWARNKFSTLPYINDPRFRIVQAQYMALMRARAIERETGVSQIEFLKGRCAKYNVGRSDFSNFDAKNWIVLMNGLGGEVRAVKGVK